VSVNAEFVPSIIVALVKQFLELPLGTQGQLYACCNATWIFFNKWAKCIFAAAGSGGGSGGSDDSSRGSSSPGGNTSQGVHRVLQRVVETFPTGTMTLLGELKERFPHKRRDVTIQKCYLENMLRVVEYVPQIVEEVRGKYLDV
jgi:hypothetical protein